MLRKLFGLLSWQMTLLVVLMFWALPVQAAAADPSGDVTIVDGGTLEDILAAAITEAAQQLGSGGTLTTLFTSPAFLTILLGLIGAVVTYFGTNGIKLSSEWFKGRRTQILAALISVATSGMGTYATLGQVADVSSVNRVVLSGLAGLSAFLVARGKHEEKRYQETGMRKPERKAASAVSEVVNSPVGKLAKSGLVALATSLGLPGAPLLVDALLSDQTLEQAERTIRQMGKRAMTVDEAQADAEATQAGRRLPTQVIPEGGL